MRTEAVAVSAVILYAGGLALLLGVRSRRHRRLTGASGLPGSGRRAAVGPRSLGWPSRLP